MREPETPGEGVTMDTRRTSARGPVTLVFGAEDEQHDQAVVLRDAIEQKAHAAPARSVRGRSAKSARAPRVNPGSA